MISKILVPTDGSKIASKSVKYAAVLAKQLGATITLLCVIDINAEALLAETVSGVDYPASLRQLMIT
jgi:nucleotide-binding universal stress UspA family protein